MSTRSRMALAVAGFAAALLTCSCFGGNDKGPTGTCDTGCPSGYACNAGVCERVALTGLDFDIHTVTVSGHITANGVAPTGTKQQGCITGQVWLTFKSDGGASFSTYVPCDTTDGAFSTRVAPGTYRVLAFVDGGTTFPTGTFLVTPKVVITGDVSGLDWDVQTVSVSGHITADGVAPTPTDASQPAAARCRSGSTPTAARTSKASSRAVRPTARSV